MVDVVLILPYTNRFGVDFDEFGERVKQATTYRHGATHRNVFVGKLFASYSRSRINRSAVFADQKYFYRTRKASTAEKLLSFTARSAVTEGYGIDFVCVDKVSNLSRSAFDVIARLSRIDCIVGKQIALTVETHHLAARTKSRVDCQYAFSGQRRCKEQLSCVVGKKVYGNFVCGVFARSGKFVFYRRFYETTIAVGDGIVNNVGTFAG